MSIVGFRLLSGEDIIGSKQGTNKETYVIENPVIAMLQEQQPGKFGLGLLPFIPFAKNQTVTFNKNAIVCDFEVEQALINEYNRLYGAGIEIVSAMPGLQIAR